MVTITSNPWEASASPNHAAPTMDPRPAAIKMRTRERRCLRKPVVKATAPNSATITESVRWMRSSSGKKCAITGENESNIGVRRQCTVQNTEAHIPILSAHSREPAVEMRNVEFIRSLDLSVPSSRKSARTGVSPSDYLSFQRRIELLNVCEPFLSIPCKCEQSMPPDSLTGPARGTKARQAIYPKPTTEFASNASWCPEISGVWVRSS